ncbi:MAG TPA: DUF6531 domain-containing protein [Candidatus Limnocylindria bacterium]|nr:DUF6531 domain-containing protein [Candidatus Limnocylindria bacterium]
MARARAIVAVLITSLVLAAFPLPLQSITRHGIPPVVAAADDDLALLPPAGWSVSQTLANDGDDGTSVALSQGSCHPNCAVTLTFTPAAGTFPAIGSFRVLWSQTSSFGSAIDFVQLTCAGTVLWHDASGFGGSGTQTYDTGRQAVTGTMAAQTAAFSCTWLMHSTLSAGGLSVYTIALWEAAAPPPPGDAGSCCPYAYALDPNGAYSTDPVNLATGNFTSHADDLVLPGRVLGLAFTRWYNSADDRDGPLGHGWTHSYNWKLTDAGATVEVRRGDGRRDTFTRNQDGSYANPPNVFDTLVKNADATFTLTLASQVVYELSSSGQLSSIHEPAGNQITFSYTAGKLTTITDTVGRQIALTYDAADRLTTLQDPLGRRVTYAYDAAGRLQTVTDKIGNAPGQDPVQHRWTYGYDGTTRHLTTITDPDGRVRVTNTYDGQGRVSQQRDALNALTQIAYGTGQTTLTDARGHETTYTFDSRMRVLTQADTVGASTYTISYLYDAAGNRTSVTDRNGQTTDFTYDARGNVLTKTDPQIDPQTPRYLTQFQYDTRNNLTQITDPLSFVTTMTYDPSTNVLLRVSRQIDASTTAVTTYEYADPASPGLPTRVIAPRGNAGPTPDDAYSTALAYDAQANLSQRIDPDGAKTTFGYDAAGRLVSFVDPDGHTAGANPSEHTWTIAYDENDRETSRTDPLGHRLAYGYDGAGDRTSLTDRNGNVTTYRYDANTRLWQTQQRPDPIGQPALVYTTEVTRDANGNATRIAQANAVVTEYAFDALDRLVSVTTHPTPTTALTTSYVLDGNGQPTSRTTGDGVTVAYGYDALSRLTSVSASGLAPISYAYDAASRRITMTDGTGTTSYQYDGLGRVTQIAAPNGTLTYAYDLDGNRTTLGYPGAQRVTYAYSPGGRMRTVTDWAGRVSSYTYTDSGLVASLAYPNGLTASYAYDRAQRLTQIINAVGETTITQHSYGLDPEGNRTALDEFVQGLTAPLLTWSASVRVNDDAAGFQQKNPALSLGADGASYLIWDDIRAGGNADIYFSRRDPTSGLWSANQKVNDDTGGRPNWIPDIALDGSNNAYAIWQDDRDGNKAPYTNIYFSKRSAATGAWSPNVRVDDSGRTASGQYTPAIAVTAAGDAVAVWRDERSSQWNVYAARLPAGSASWSANLRVTDDTSARKFTPDVAVGPDGTAYAVWEDERSGNSDIYFATLPAGSSTWSANVRISDDPGSADQYDPHIGIDAAGGLLVVYDDDRLSLAGQVRVTRRPAGSGTWQTSRVVSDASAIPSALSLSVRPDGGAFVAWEDARGTDWDIWGSEYDVSTDSWSTPARLDDGPAATHQLDPAVAYAAGGLSLAWRDLRAESVGDIRASGRTPSPGTDQLAYAYDGLSRLVSVSGTASETFTLDPASNITSRTGPTATNSYDGANRLLSDGTRVFTWDGADRLVGRGGDTFAYDPLSRMTSSTLSGTTRTYAYDGDGLLAARSEGGSTTSLLWDTSLAPAPLLQSGSDRLVHGLGPLYIAHQDGSSTMLARDGLGSVRAELDGAGTVLRSARYAAYGALTASSGGAPTLLGYAGELADPSGLLYLRARWYDVESGRFLTRDPFPGSVIAPSMLNRFSYVMGNPVTHVDPIGRACLPCIGAVIGAGAGLAGYWASTTARGQQFDVGQALISAGTGAIAGAACTGGVLAGCVAVSAAVSAVQYAAAPGTKSVEGYAVATTVGALAGRLSFTRTLGGPYFEGPLSWDPRLLDEIGVGFDWARSIAGNFFRSFAVSTASGLAPTLVDEAALGSDVGAGPEPAGPGK